MEVVGADEILDGVGRSGAGIGRVHAGGSARATWARNVIADHAPVVRSVAAGHARAVLRAVKRKSRGLGADGQFRPGPVADACSTSGAVIHRIERVAGI